MQREGYQPLAQRVVPRLSELLEDPNYGAQAVTIARIIQAENGVRLAGDAIKKQLQAGATQPDTE